MNEQELLKRLDALAAKIGTTVEHLWPELVRYEVAAVWRPVVGGLLWAAGLVALAAMLRLWGTKTEDAHARDGFIGGSRIAVILALFVAVLTLSLFDFATLAAPEAAALQRLMETDD